jgi:hypothetical protein
MFPSTPICSCSLCSSTTLAAVVAVEIIEVDASGVIAYEYI